LATLRHRLPQLDGDSRKRHFEADPQQSRSSATPKTESTISFGKGVLRIAFFLLSLAKPQGRKERFDASRLCTYFWP
jgi:hypothetical protein